MVDFGERGLRTPTHQFALTQTPSRLEPFMAAPMRPGETLIGAQLNGYSMLNHLVKAPWARPITVELGLYLVPISTLGNSFVRFFTGDMEDSHGFFGQQVGGSGTHGTPAATAVDEQGHRDIAVSPYQRVHRRWAGESGPRDITADALVSSEFSTYVPYVAAATHRVAEMFYEVEGTERVGGAELESENYWDNPPLIAQPIDSALVSSVPFGSDAVGSTHVDEFPPEEAQDFSFAQFAQRMSIMQKANQTFPEYLESFGVNPKRAAGMPECVAYQRQDVMPRLDNAHGAIAENFFGFGVDSADNLITSTFSTTDSANIMGTFSTSDIAGASTLNFVGDNSPMASMSTRWNVRRNKRWMIDEPTILIGVCAWHLMNSAPESYGHVMDMSRMTVASHWGQPPGLDEADFLGVGALFDPTGAAIQSDQSGGEPGNRRAYNMLNLYLNGDTFTNDTAGFDFWTPGQGTSGTPDDDAGVSPITNDRFNTLGTVRLAVATDLVS